MKTLLLMLPLLTACAAPQQQWIKAGGSPQDQQQCQYEANKATQQTDTTLKGGLAAEIDRSMRRNDLMAECMRSRGYVKK